MVIKTTGLNPHDDHIAHYGIPGMRWGRRKQRDREKERVYGKNKTLLNKSKSLYTMMSKGKGTIASRATDLYKKGLAKAIDSAYNSTKEKIQKCEVYKEAAKAVGNISKYKAISDMQKNLSSQTQVLNSLRSADIANMHNDIFRQQMMHQDLMTQIIQQQMHNDTMMSHNIAMNSSMTGHNVAMQSHMIGMGMM